MPCKPIDITIIVGIIAAYGILLIACRQSALVFHG